MRGLFRSVRIPSANIFEVRLESIQPHSHEHGYSKKQRYANGQTNAILPPSVSFCRDFHLFLSRLERLARLNKQSATSIARRQSRDINHLPVEDWTSKDIDDYEKNS